MAVPRLLDGDAMIAIDRIEALTREAFAPWPIDRLEVAATEDHDGDPVFKVKVFFRNMKGEVDLRDFIPVENSLRDKAWAEGNRAFSHIPKKFDPEQDFVGFRRR